MRVGLLLVSIILTLYSHHSLAKEKPKKPKGKSSTLAIYRNGRFGFQIQYPKNWKTQFSQNGDGFSANWKDQELSAAASFLGTVDETDKTLPLKRLINYWEPGLRIKQTQAITVADVYSNKTCEALIGFGNEKNKSVIKLITRDETIVYNVWATNISKATALSLIKSFKITKGEEKY